MRASTSSQQTSPISHNSSLVSGSTSGTSVKKTLRRQLSRVFPLSRNKRNGAKNKFHPPNCHSPELPAELWMLILEYSTYPSFSTTDTIEFDSSPPPSLELPSSFLSPAPTPASLAPRLTYHRALMAHKRNLTLVCRKWHSYAQPVLYSFVWIARAKQAKALALTLLCQACCLSPQSVPATEASAGRFIRRLHIETPALERCHPADLRTILEYAPGLEVYSDYRSVRRVRGSILSSSTPPSNRETDNGPCNLFAKLAEGGGALKRLTWTSYDDPTLVSLGIGLGLRGGYMGERLEYLELNFVSSSAFSPKVTTKCLPACSAGLILPTLRTLKVTLDNGTFLVLSSWVLPALRNLSVVSADFSYAADGFRRFFEVHGGSVRQLELGHSSACIEEAWLTTPHLPPHNPQTTSGWQALSLASLCPHLDEFICSADAEWNWEHPDWIAPHLLLPAHPNVSFIGIRGIEGRVGGDGGLGTNHHAALFGLREQMETLLRREAFPRLKYVRDMSEGSDWLRRGLWTEPMCSSCSEMSSNSSLLSLVGQQQHPHQHSHANPLSSPRARQRIVRFWEGVLQRCREEGVWLEDWRGWNVTRRTLMRARAALEAEAEMSMSRSSSSSSF
ncbi:hypothetical protein MIND_01199500 [Mycena indigotica]|uniref:Uncharacterized protein n=1 Tax=Mycena indigotica TaxID=2126181 RepID=A0A8H6S5X6_9AGAR|nr:uncharacterized protein MIND_01199500 [Mycena indigotica]KAF7293002.1 hypothetical protein MIND_01199500 [Mycena indigotica]